MEQPAAGIDIGGTNTRIGIAGKDGVIQFSDRLRTRDYSGFESFLQAICDALLVLETKAGVKVTRIGAGAPNLNYYTGNIENAANLPWKGILPLRELLEKGTERKVITDNDANAAAAGEMMFGKATGMNDFIQITLGTGVGSGIVANGKIIRGCGGMAGEAGHMIVENNGRSCGCGRKGCLETYCSVKGIALNYDELSGEHTLKGAREIAAMAEKGDANALGAYNMAGEILGTALANLAAVTAPEAIILSGGLSRAGELLFTPAARSFKASLLHLLENRTTLMLTGIHAGEAGLYGAIALTMLH